jgi:hypothetical protein
MRIGELAEQAGISTKAIGLTLGEINQVIAFR